jgi:uroporphyrinogen-III synthase
MNDALLDSPEGATETLRGYRVGVTAARKVEEQVALLERRGAVVEWAPALKVEPNQINEGDLRAATAAVLAEPVDIFVATTGIGIKSWFSAVEGWGLLPQLIEHLSKAEILARGPKSVGALRSNGLRELWTPQSERFEDVLAHLRGRDLSGCRIVVQEHGQSLSVVAHALRRQGADVRVVTVYRVEGAPDPQPMFRLIDLIAERKLDAVTFTSAPAVASLMDLAGAVGRRDEVIAAFQADVIALGVGPVTSAAFELWGVPSIHPERSRMAAMIKLLETELPSRREGTAIEVDGHTLLLHGDKVLLDSVVIPLSPAPLSVLHALAVNPGHVVSRRDLLSALPTGQASSEHAVEMAVARLRAALGTRLVQTVVKRGYRLVTS